MKVGVSAIMVLLTAAVGTAHGQSIVSHGVGLAHDCFVMAKIGRDARGGVDVCNQALQREMLTPKDQAATHDNRGVLLDLLGKTDEAEDDFHIAIRLDPGLGDPHVNLGSVLIKKGRLEEALVEINKGLELGSSFPHIGYYDRAVAEQRLGRYREAYYDYKKVLELEPSYSQAEERLKDFVVVRKPADKPG